MSSQNNNNKLAIKFRCPGELEGLLPQPVPANLGVPDWLNHYLRPDPRTERQSTDTWS